MAIRPEEVMHALSDPVRLQLVRQMAAATGPMACGSLDVPVIESTASHHFRLLRAAGVTRDWDIGTQRMNELRRDDLAARFPGLLGIVVDAGTEASTAPLHST